MVWTSWVAGLRHGQGFRVFVVARWSCGVGGWGWEGGWQQLGAGLGGGGCGCKVGGEVVLRCVMIGVGGVVIVSGDGGVVGMV